MDRRGYERINVNAEGVFVLDDTEVLLREFNADIEDISESGVRLTVDSKYTEDFVSYLGCGADISFSAVEEFELFGKLVSEVFSGKLTVVRQFMKGDRLSIGCRFKRTTHSIEKYVSDRKLSRYIASLS